MRIFKQLLKLGLNISICFNLDNSQNYTPRMGDTKYPYVKIQKNKQIGSKTIQKL